MVMSDHEILTSYREAKNKFKQLAILAELNACSNKEMAKFLMDAGEEVDRRYIGHLKPVPQEEPVEEVPFEEIEEVEETDDDSLMELVNDALNLTGKEMGLLIRFIDKCFGDMKFDTMDELLMFGSAYQKLCILESMGAEQ